MTARLTTALVGLMLLTFAAVWAVVHYSFIYIGGRGFTLIETVQKPVNVPVGGAEQVRIALHLLYGDLHLSTGTDVLLAGTEALVAGSARYNVAEFAPHVLYEVEGNRGQLLMDHLQGIDYTRFFNRTGRTNEWDLAINDQVQIENLELVLGMGNGYVGLRGLNLRHAELNLLAGESTVDLRGTWAQNSAVEIVGVTGAVTLLVPSEMNTLVTVNPGPYTLHVSGLTALPAPPALSTRPLAATMQDGEGPAEQQDEDNYYYVTPAYEPGATLLDVQVSQAFGTLTVAAE